MATINSTLSNTLLSGTSGDDYIANYGWNVTIKAGKGDDTIENGDEEENTGDVTIDGGAGNDSIVNNEFNDVISINGGKGNDVINNGGSMVKLLGDDDNDYIYNWGEFVDMYGGAGNDTIENSGIEVLIDGGKGDDDIWNEGNSVTINTGDGNDYVGNSGSSVTINTGAGNDYVRNYGSYVTINAGAGNDSIENLSVQVTFQYKAGDGNDFISGFSSSDTLSIGGGSYSTTKSGDDVIVTVGEGKISLVGAATLSSVNIKGTSGGGNSKFITLTEGNDTYSNSVSDATISALGGKDTVYNHADNVSINTGAGNDYVGNGLSSDSVTINTGAGNDSVSNDGSSVTIDTGAGNDSVYNSHGNLVSINTGAGNDSVDNYHGDSVTINTGYGNDYVVNSTNSDLVTINTGDGDDSVVNEWSDSVTINTGAGNDEIFNNCYLEDDGSIWYRNTNGGSNVLFKYAAGDGNDIIYGFKADSTLSIGGGSYSTTKSGNNIIVTVGEGKVSLIGAASLSTVNIVGKKSSAETNSWKLNGTTATYGTSSKTLITITGVKSADGLSLSGKTVTVAASALNQAKVTLSGSGYKLKLANDVSTTATTSNDWSYKSSVATLKQTKGAYYSLAGNGKTISYSAGTTKTLVTVSGVKSADGLSVKNKVVTVAASALNKSKVTLSGSGYKLKLANDVSTSAKAKNAWSYKNSVATLSQTKAAYYSLASNGKSISYSKGTSKNLATISGLTSASGLKLSGKVITIPNSIIATSKKVAVNGSGYNFKFAAKKTAITGSKNADIITSGGANSTINAGKGNDSINISGANNVIVYKSGDGSDTINNYSEDDTIKITSGAAQVSTSGADVIFTVGNGSILLKDAADKTVSYVAGGVKKTYTAPSAEPYTVNGAAVVLSSSYAEESFDVENDVDGGKKLKTIDATALAKGINITGNENANKILGGTGNDTLDGYSGNDTLTGGNGSDIFIYYTGDGKDVITDYAAKDMIAIEEGEVIPTVKGRDVVLNVGEGSITVQKAAKNKIGVTYVEDGVEHDYLNGEQTVVMNEKKTTATITKNYWKDSVDFANFGKSISTLDATPVMHNIKITGNDKANKIIGGSGKNTLQGGGGNDTLQGGDKADIFVYNSGDGNDIIYNVGTNDTVSIVSGTVDFASVKGDTVIFTVGDGKISVEGGAGNKITYCDEHGKTSKLYSNPNANVVENWFVEDNFATENDLSALVQSNAADYSVVNVESALRSISTLETLTCSTKT